MDHLIAKIRSAKGARDSKLKKVLSGKTVFNLTDEFSSFVPYEPDHNLDPGTWFGIDKFSEKTYFLNWLAQPFSSAAFAQLSASEAESIDYICAYQAHNAFCFQRITKSSYLKKLFIMLGDNYSIESNKTILLINATPDAVYLRDIDTLFFKQIPAISTIFNGIDVLYREATAREAQAFLQSPFITLQNGFSAQNVSKPNLHRISMAMETLRGLEDTQVQEVVSYIQDYCPALPCSDGQFSIGTDNQLKYLLYGIEQRYYTTVITREKRLANSVISLGT